MQKSINLHRATNTSLAKLQCHPFESVTFELILESSTTYGSSLYQRALATCCGHTV
jgi:hypothetical protein